MGAGSITVVGSGIKAVSGVTLEAARLIETADAVLYLVADPLSAEWIREVNPSAVSIQKHYAEGRPRIESYHGMIDEALQAARAGADVCVVFYGHPGIFVYPSHEMVRLAREEGIEAKMLPGISADACLFADLGVDPARHGCSSFEATDFLIHERVFDARSALVLWQVGVIGDMSFKGAGYDSKANVEVLTERLRLAYQPDHPVVVYEAAQYPVCEPRIERITVESLVQCALSPISTLYIPPKRNAAANAAIMKKLGMEVSATVVPARGDAHA